MCAKDYGVIAILDYGVGNLRSVQKSFEAVGVFPKITSSPQELLAQDRLIIPGVGAFGKAIENLRALGVEDALREHVFTKQKPVIGICVGMQILADEGLEFGTHRGLGWIKGSVRPLRDIVGKLPVPHIGWNEVKFKTDDVMSRGFENSSSFYFANSFYFDAAEQNDVAAMVEYGQAFPAALRRGNIWGVQFHPEKSQKVGLQVLKNFCQLS